MKTCDARTLPPNAQADLRRKAVTAVRERIAGEFALDVSVRKVGRYLRDWGFTPQKPARRALQQNPQTVRRRLSVEYPVNHKQAKAENGEIYWEDEMGLRSDHSAGRSYAPRGRQARDAKEMMSNVRGYLRRTQRQPELVSRYFHAEPVRYAANP